MVRFGLGGAKEFSHFIVEKGAKPTKLPETFSNRTTPLSSTDYSETLRTSPLFWLTDAFLYTKMRTDKGSYRMLADWGYPPC